jgi:hypothetical protein
MQENVGGFGFNEEAMKEEYDKFVKEFKKSEAYKEADDKSRLLYNAIKKEYGLEQNQTFQDWLEVHKRTVANKILKGESFGVVDAPK